MAINVDENNIEIIKQALYDRAELLYKQLDELNDEVSKPDKDASKKE